MRSSTLAKTFAAGLLLAVLTALFACREAAPVLYDVARRRTVALDEAVSELKGRRIVLVGEHHTDARHHAWQLAVIRALDAAGVPVAVGLEMFRADSQPALDRWLAGEMGEDAFRRVYQDNWNYPYRLYRGIFDYARERGIPLVGLNVGRAITRQVAQEGFASLTADQRGKLSDIVCDVDEAYRRFVERAHGDHAHGGMQFEHFCEAQLVWDSVMALNAADWLAAHPGRVMVVVAGTGHVWKGGIPAQLERRGAPAAVVILPATADRIDPVRVSPADADYVIMPS